MEFRVSICLTRYYNDERSFCYFYMNDKYSTIASFAQRLRQQFKLKNNFCLMTNKYLLPNEESAKIINPGDEITVIPIQKYWWNNEESEAIADHDSGSNDTVDVTDSVVIEKVSKKKKKKKTKSDVSANYIEEEPIQINSEKPSSVESEVTKKKDSCMDISMMSLAEPDHEETSNEDNIDNEDSENQNSCDSDIKIQESHKIAEVQSTIQQLKMKALSLLNEVSSQKPVTGVSGGRINKRKRIRKRNKNSSLSMSTPDLSDTATTAPITFKPIIKPANHIRFDNEQQSSIPNTVRNAEITTKPRIIHAIDINSNASSRRASICSSGDGPTKTSQMVNVNDNRETNEKSDSSARTFSIENITKRLSDFPVMDNVYPVTKDFIMFKMLRMGSDYTPIISEFILGDVISVDKPNGIVKISIIDGHDQCRPVVGKFDLESKEETQNTDNLIIEVDWTQVSEARLVFP